MTFSKEQAKEISTNIGIDWDKVEFTLKDFLRGLKELLILGKEIGIDWNAEQFAVGDLMQGMFVELEHNVNKKTDVVNNRIDILAKIAAAHLFEKNDYYQKLKRVGL